MPRFLPKSIVCFREGYTRERLLHDLIAGVTVGIVALPLAMAFGIASIPDSVVQTARELRLRGRSDGPDLLGYLDLVALATVADVVPLTGVNRAFVVKGLMAIRRMENAGLAALTRVSTANIPANMPSGGLPPQAPGMFWMPYPNTWYGPFYGFFIGWMSVGGFQVWHPMFGPMAYPDPYRQMQRNIWVRLFNSPFNVFVDGGPNGYVYAQYSPV